MSREGDAPDGEASRSVLASVGRVAPLASGVVPAMAVGGCLAAVGVAGLTWVLGLGGAFAVGLLLTGRWAANRTLSWAAAIVFLATMVFPVIALGATPNWPRTGSGSKGRSPATATCPAPTAAPTTPRCTPETAGTSRYAAGPTPPPTVR